MGGGGADGLGGRAQGCDGFPIGVSCDVSDEGGVGFAFWGWGDDPVPRLAKVRGVWGGKGEAAEDVPGFRGWRRGFGEGKAAPGIVGDKGGMAWEAEEIVEVGLEEVAAEGVERIGGEGGGEEAVGNPGELGEEIDGDGEVEIGLRAECGGKGCGQVPEAFVLGGALRGVLAFWRGESMPTWGEEVVHDVGEVAAYGKDVGEAAQGEASGEGVDDVGEEDGLEALGESGEGDVVEEAGTEEEDFPVGGAAVGGLEDEVLGGAQVGEPSGATAGVACADLEGAGEEAQASGQRGSGGGEGFEPLEDHGCAGRGVRGVNKKENREARRGVEGWPEDCHRAGASLTEGVIFL